MHDDNLNGTVIVGIFEDLAEQKLLEEEIRRNDRLRVLGQLSAGVAHEIRNPLNTISIAAQRLAAEFEPKKDTEEFDSIAGQIKAETKRLNAIITRFLALAREEKNHRRSINLTEQLHQLVTLYDHEARQGKIDMRLDVEEELRISSDEETVRQIFANLFNNAREAVGGGPGVIEIRAGRQGDMVFWEFEDSGAGIPDDLRDKVLTPYFTTKDGGTGLGLPTVHRLVLDAGGILELARGRQGGLKVMMTFPVADQQS